MKSCKIKNLDLFNNILSTTLHYVMLSDSMMSRDAGKEKTWFSPWEKTKFWDELKR
jgi:hypothetical protein